MQSATLSERLEYAFGDERLARLALTHSSWCAEHDEAESNERLEFLGDAVLGLAVAAHVYDRFPDLPEGSLAKIRAPVVSSASLAEVGRRLGLGDELRLGKGEAASGGADKPSILADAVEAVIGAVFVDGGWDAARAVVHRLLGDEIERAALDPGVHDFKTRLQELLAQRGDGAPRYLLDMHGPDHDKRFTARVVIDGATQGEGQGTSKKQAEQEAARRAWASLSGAPSDHGG